MKYVSGSLCQPVYMKVSLNLSKEPQFMRA